MKNRRDDADAYAETLVMPATRGILPARGDESDPLALYEEYARELTHEAGASAQPRRPKR
jgi:hypothetical protein